MVCEKGMNKRAQLLAALAPAVMSAGLLLAGCAPAAEPAISASVVTAMSAPAGAQYARALQPRTFAFPGDHGPHPQYRTEWWYYTGNLAGPDGQPFGYQLTFFRTALAPELPPRASDLATNQVYMAHFAVTDGQRQSHESFDRYSRGAGELAGASSDPRFQVWLEDWSAEQIAPGKFRLQARAAGKDGPVGIDLILAETRPPILHGSRGLHQKGPEPGNASYYYSLAGLTSTGVITSSGQAAPVTGLSWMDHEFGTSALSQDAVGWDWFALQLDNGAALMLYQIRAKSGAQLPGIQGTLVWPDGRQQAISKADFQMQATGQWTSPRTQITYPSGWRIAFPALDVHLTLTPLTPDQEMNVSFVYWEGAVDAAGDWQGAPVKGRGYVELTGYGEGGGGYQR